jgi:3-dehydroquinate synthase
MTDPTVTMTRTAAQTLDEAIDGLRPDKVFVLYDDTTQRLCAPLLAASAELRHATTLTIPATDAHKNLEALASVWQSLSDGGASRRSLLVNVGGGMVTDLGGFAASTFKRGIAYINIPTTLLAMVDASVGGKTAINFNGLKNEIGVFNAPRRVIVDMHFLRTLGTDNLLSGYAEMIKHGLISNARHWAQLMRFNFNDCDNGNTDLHDMVAESINIKASIVKQDPHERGLRKALNVGHTAGHALESLALASGHPVLHGYAVAWGIVCELFLSRTQKHFPTTQMQQTISYIRENYGAMAFSCKDYPRLFQLMCHDKKNEGGNVNFTLLSGIGKIELNCTATKDKIYAMLDFYRDAMD